MQLNQMAAAKKPHAYVETTPYRGCGACGFGPGAYVHNHWAVRDAEQERMAENLRQACDA